MLICGITTSSYSRTNPTAPDTEENRTKASELEMLQKAESIMILKLANGDVGRGNYKEATKWFNQVADRFPAETELGQQARQGMLYAQLLTAVDFLATGKFKRADAEAAKALTAVRDSEVVKQFRSFIGGLSSARKRPRTNSPEEMGFQDAIDCANALLEAGKLEEAERTIQEILRRNMLNARAIELLRTVLKAKLDHILPDTTPKRPAGKSRPITNAETVMAIFVQDWRWGSWGDKLIAAIWGNGKAVWSENRIHGGPPYRTAQIDPTILTKLLTRMEKDGYFEKELSRSHVAPGSMFTSILVKHGKQHIEMSSMHEISEPSGFIATDGGLEFPSERRRLEVLAKEKRDYLFFRFLWAETRALIPDTSTPHKGVIWMKAGKMSWIESEAEK